MELWRLTIRVQSPLGTPLKGDTLFGQLCWGARHRWGDLRLRELLREYTLGRPFAVISDAFPHGHLPRPTLPAWCWENVPDIDRKALKKRVWMPLSHCHLPVRQWLSQCVADADLGLRAVHRPQPHNTIHRGTGTTGTGAFAPYTQPQTWLGRDTAQPGPVLLDIYVLMDPQRLPPQDAQEIFAAMGAMGFGRDASIGLGKFTVHGWESTDLPSHPEANAWMTLAPCAPQGLNWERARCFAKPFTRFGRHGDLGVLSGLPFKSPVLLADTAAVLTPREYAPVAFIGQGLGGDGTLSKAIPGTVHQGFAPVLPIHLNLPA